MLYRYGRKGIGVQYTPRLFRKYRFVFFWAFDYEDKQQRTAAARGLKDLVRMLYAADDMAATIQAAGRLFTEYAKARTDESRRTEALEKWEQTRHKRGEKDAPK